MNRYVLEDRIGEGTFGNVYRATKKGDPEYGKFYAVKKLKQTFSSWKDVAVEREFDAIAAFMRIEVKEKSSKNEEEEKTGHRQYDLNNRNHLVRVYEILREQNSCLYFVMEYMKDGNLHEYIASKSKNKSESLVSNPNDKNNTNKVLLSIQRDFDESEIRSILFQTLRGLCHIHSLGYVHRDIKPENILLHGRTVKLADFSLSRGVGSCSQQPRRSDRYKYASSCDDGAMMTKYIGTRWYRAPELLRNHRTNFNKSDDDDDEYGSYTKAIDVFAMGCVAAELYRCAPLFLGKDETEQLRLIEDLLFVTPSSLPSGVFGGGGDSEGFFDEEEEKENDAIVKNRLAQAIPTADHRAVHFIHNLLHLRPERRTTTRDVLRQPYFERESMDVIGKDGSRNIGRTGNANAIRARRSSMLGPQEATTPPIPSNKGHAQMRTAMSPVVPFNNKNKTITTLPLSSSVRITPTAGAAVDSLTTMRPKDRHRLFLRNDGKESNHATSSAVEAQLWDDDDDQIVVLNDKQSPVTIHTRTSLLKRKRPKLRPSQVFNID